MEFFILDSEGHSIIDIMLNLSYLLPPISDTIVSCNGLNYGESNTLVFIFFVILKKHTVARSRKLLLSRPKTLSELNVQGLLVL